MPNIVMTISMNGFIDLFELFRRRAAVRPGNCLKLGIMQNWARIRINECVFFGTLQN